MIEKIFIVAFIVLAIWYTMQPKEIFGRLGQWLKNHLPEKLHDPIFSCPACMCFWHGTYVYWAIWGWWLKTALWQEWAVVVIAGIGINAIASNLFSKDSSQEYIQQDEPFQGSE